MAIAPDLRLRPATGVDSVRVRELVYSILREFGFTPNPDETDSDLADLDRSYIQSGGAFDVIEDEGGALVGSVGLFPMEDGSVELRKMYLRADVRGRGLG